MNIDRLKTLFYVDNGILWRKISRGRARAGQSVGTLNRVMNRLYVKIDGKNHTVHRIIFAIHNGFLPNEIDHIDGNSLNNHPDNLRACTGSQNRANRFKVNGSKSPYKGVTTSCESKSWRAQIKCEGRGLHIGSFKSEIDAAIAYDIEAKRLFGEYARLNFPMAGKEAK